MTQAKKLFLSTVFGFLALNSKAQEFAGTDNFTSLNNWNEYPTVNGASPNYGAGFLEEHTSHLNYVTNSNYIPASQDLWEWTPGVAPIADSWIMSMGVANSVISTTGDAEIGFGIADTADLLGNNLDFTLASFQGTQEFRLNLTTNGGTATHTFAVTKTQNASILLWFDAPSDTLHVWYNSSPTDPNFSDLIDLPLDQIWGLQPTDTVTFFAIGASTDQVVQTNANPAYGYNFAITDLSPAPEPPPIAMLLTGVCVLAGIFSLRRTTARA